MASSTLWRANSSGKRSPSGFRMENSSTTMAFSRLPPRARPGLLHHLDVAQEAEGAGARHLPLVVAVGEGEAEGLVGDERVLEVDGELDGERVGRLEAGQLVAVADLDGPLHQDELLAGALLGDAALADEGHEGGRGAVEDGDLGTVDLDAAVVDAHAGERREDVLDGVDAGLAEGEVGGEGGVGDVLGAGRDLGAEVHANEADAAVGRGRGERQRCGPPGVEAHPRAGHALRQGSLIPVAHVFDASEAATTRHAAPRKLPASW